MTDPTVLDAIRARDAELRYCATCRSRVYFNQAGQIEGPHDTTVEECEAALEAQAQADGTDLAKRRYKFYPEDSPERVRDKMANLGPKMLCWTASDHHPFVEDTSDEAIPDYEQEARDRRVLLRLIDSLPVPDGSNLEARP